MANLQVNQIRKHLTDNYIRFVDASDIKATDEDKDIHILSRAYAAYAVVTLGNYEPQDVCACITDEYEDNGIDLVYIDNISKKMWIVQSKFSFNGNKITIINDTAKKMIRVIYNLSNNKKFMYLINKDEVVYIENEFFNDLEYNIFKKFNKFNENNNFISYSCRVLDCCIIDDISIESFNLKLDNNKVLSGRITNDTLLLYCDKMVKYSININEDIMNNINKYFNNILLYDTLLYIKKYVSYDNQVSVVNI